MRIRAASAALLGLAVCHLALIPYGILFVKLECVSMPPPSDWGALLLITPAVAAVVVWLAIRIQNDKSIELAMGASVFLLIGSFIRMALLLTNKNVHSMWWYLGEILYALCALSAACFCGIRCFQPSTEKKD